MAMNRSTRKSTLLELVKRKALSTEGMNALIKATDPFHDTEVECVGIPDALPEKSIVREVRKSVTISSPLADKTLPWDCHIFTLPERNYYAVGDADNGSWPGRLYGSGIFDVTPPPGELSKEFPIGPIVIVTCAAGTATTPADPAFNPLAVTTQVLDYNDYYAGQSREIFSAFEVHNVTNQLNIGGTVTTYRLPQFTFASDISVTFNDSANAFAQPYALISRLPPGSLEQSLLLPGTRQWEAKDGCYCVETFDMDHNLPQAATFCSRILASGDFVGGKNELEANVIPAVGTFRGNTASQAPGIWWFSQSHKPVAKDTSGSYFTGLPGQSQLTLTVRKGIETFPTFSDSLVTLARATPDHDPVFFELYKRIAQELPPGVAVSENASGDFWDKILGIIGEVAPSIGSSLGPAGGAIGSLASMAAKAAQNARNKPKQKADDTNFKGGKANVIAPRNVLTNTPKK